MPSLLTTLMLALSASAAPQLKYGENTGAVGGVSSTPQATAPSGSLYGSAKLQGGDAKIPDTKGPSADVPKPDHVEGQDADADLGVYLNMNSVERPQPMRGGYGNTDAGPRTFEYEKLNPDKYAPPGTDKGSVPNAMWPMGLSHNRLGSDKGSGWARQQNTEHLPNAKEMAGVDMKLGPNAYRELHWHTANEWALVLKGCTRVSAVNEEGKTFTDDVCEGDVWFFPAGIPHSIQAFENGVEFLLVFDQGDFDENETFLVSQMFARTPRSVLSKNFKADVSAFKDLPEKELYIFNGTPQPRDPKSQNITSPAGELTGNGSYTYHWSQQKPFITEGGSVKILDPTTFPVADMFSTALVTLKPGAMREIHWHTTSDEWNYFLQGSARVTIFKAPDAGRTFDYTAGSVGYVPASNAHYIENTGDEDVIFLEVLQAPKFTDISVAQWLALTPKQVVKDHLRVPDSVVDNLPKEKEILKPGNVNLTAVADSGKAY